jgi:hypothetical protein
VDMGAQRDAGERYIVAACGNASELSRSGHAVAPLRLRNLTGLAALGNVACGQQRVTDAPVSSRDTGNAGAPSSRSPALLAVGALA